MATVLNLFLASLVSGIPIRQWNVEFDSPSAVRRILDPDVGAHLARRADTSHDMKYYGGPILQNIEVTTIFYGSGVLYQNETNAFYEFLVKSPYMAMLFEYNAGYGRFIGSYLETNNIKTVVDDKLDIIPYLKGLVQAGILKPNANSYYPIHFAPGTNITQGNSKSCINFCGYHGTIDISTIYNGTKYLSYGVLPSHTGQCYGGCGRSVDPFRNLCSISSHELAEAVTNPAIGVVTRFGKPLSWYNRWDGEVGDFCNLQEFSFKDLDGTNWALQKLWSNYYQACATVSQGYFGAVKPTSILRPPTQLLNLTYYGGPIITNIEVNMIMYGNVVNSSDIAKFYKYYTASQMIDFISSEYSQTSAPIGYGSFQNNISISNVKSIVDDDADVKPLLLTLLKNGALKPNNNSYYPIHLEAGVTATRRGSVSCQHFCSYHGAIDISVFKVPNTKYLYYAVIPYPCDTGCGTQSAFSNTCSVSSAQISAVITNPALNIAASASMPMGWYETRNGYEIGDACTGVQGSIGNYTIQALWSNQQRLCYLPIDNEATLSTRVSDTTSESTSSMKQQSYTSASTLPVKTISFSPASSMKSTVASPNSTATTNWMISNMTSTASKTFGYLSSSLISFAKSSSTSDRQKSTQSLPSTMNVLIPTTSKQVSLFSSVALSSLQTSSMSKQLSASLATGSKSTEKSTAIRTSTLSKVTVISMSSISSSGTSVKTTGATSTTTRIPAVSTTTPRSSNSTIESSKKTPVSGMTVLSSSSAVSKASATTTTTGTTKASDALQRNGLKLGNTQSSMQQSISETKTTTTSIQTSITRTSLSPITSTATTQQSSSRNTKSSSTFVSSINLVAKSSVPATVSDTSTTRQISRSTASNKVDSTQSLNFKSASTSLSRSLKPQTSLSSQTTSASLKSSSSSSSSPLWTYIATSVTAKGQSIRSSTGTTSFSKATVFSTTAPVTSTVRSSGTGTGTVKLHTSSPILLQANGIKLGSTQSSSIPVTSATHARTTVAASTLTTRTTPAASTLSTVTKQSSTSPKQLTSILASSGSVRLVSTSRQSVPSSSGTSPSTLIPTPKSTSTSQRREVSQSLNISKSSTSTLQPQALTAQSTPSLKVSSQLSLQTAGKSSTLPNTTAKISSLVTAKVSIATSVTTRVLTTTAAAASRLTNISSKSQAPVLTRATSAVLKT